MGTVNTSIIMACHNRKSLLEHTLRGYNNYPFHGGVELIIVDDGSTDGLEGVIFLARRSFQRVLYLAIGTQGFRFRIGTAFHNPALGLNAGVRHSLGRLTILTCPECYPLNDNIRIMQSIMDSGENKLYCFGKAAKTRNAVNAAMEADSWYPKNEMEMLERIPDAYDHIAVSEKGPRGPYPYFAGLRKSDYEAVNGIDEEFMGGYGCEDDDFSFRIRRSGIYWKWTDQCIVAHLWHPGPGNLAVDYERNRRLMDDRKRSNLIRANGDIGYGSQAVVLKRDVYE